MVPVIGEKTSSAARVALLVGCVTVAAAQEIPFVDKTGGYEVRLPVGWIYDRTGFFGPGGSLGLLRGASPDGHTTCQILLFRNVKDRTFPEWFDFFCTQIGGVAGVERVRAKGLGETPRPSGYVRVDARDGGNRIETHYSCQAFDERTVWVLAIGTVRPRDSRVGEAVTSTGEADLEMPETLKTIVASLRVFYSAERAAEQAAALGRGRDFLARLELQTGIRALRIDEKVRHYELVLGGAPIGYLTRQFLRETRGLDDSPTGRAEKEGLRVRERSWRFSPDGTARYSEFNLFSSVDGETDLFESSQTEIPPDSATARPVTYRDQFVREGDALFASYFTSLDADRPDPRRPLKVDDSYVGLAWARLLPAVLGTTPAAPTAFTIYDAETRALVTYSVQPLGEKACPGIADEPAFLYVTSEGLSETPTRVWTDRRGHLLRAEAGDLVVRRVESDAIERDYGSRRAAAQQRLRSLASQPAAPRR